MAFVTLATMLSGAFASKNFSPFGVRTLTPSQPRWSADESSESSLTRFVCLEKYVRSNTVSEWIC